MSKIYLKKIKASEESCESCYFLLKKLNCIRLEKIGKIPSCYNPSTVFIQVPPPEVKRCQHP